MTHAPEPGEPGSANSPATPGDTPRVSDRVSPGVEPPASNQGKDESLPPATDATAGAGTVASSDPQSTRAGLGGSDGPGSETPNGTTAPANVQGMSAPAVEAAPGTSEQGHIVEGVRASRGAVPGQPEGEVDTRT